MEGEGRSGGLVLLWKNTINMYILQYSKFDIHGFIFKDDIGWYLMSFYGQPDMSKTNESWSLLSSLCNTEYAPWLLLRDFNEIVDLRGKSGGLSNQNNRWLLFKMCSLGVSCLI